MDLIGNRYDVNSVGLAQDRIHWWDLVMTVMYLQVLTRQWFYQHDY